MNQLEAENIRAAYGKKEVLRGVSFSLAKGEIMAVIGPNGAGKSTLLKVLAGFLNPTAGKVWLDGKEITSFPPHERARLGIAYVMQGGRVFPNLTVRENLQLAAATVRPDTLGDPASVAVDLFPVLKDFLRTRAGLLSGGERQALALAMMLIRRPALILLDEPSAGLAPRLAETVLNRIRELRDRLDVTILLVEQRVREALRLSQRAIVLTGGSVASETASPASWVMDGALDTFFFGTEQPQLERVS